MIQTFISLIVGLALLFCSAILYFKLPGKKIYLILLISGLFVMNLLSGSDFLHVFISAIIIGASAGFTFRNIKKFQFYILLTSLTLALIFSANHYYLKVVNNVDILKVSKDRFAELLKKNQDISDNEKNDLFLKIDESIEVIEDVIPFAYFLNAMIFSLLSLFFLKMLFTRKLNSDENLIDGIENFRIKENLIYIFIVAWAIVLLVDSELYAILYIVGLNIALIFSVFYAIQAFGIIKFFLLKKNLPVIILPVSLSVFWIFGIEYVFFIMIILSSIGALDFWTDFRKLDSNTNVDNKQ